MKNRLIFVVLIYMLVGVLTTQSVEAGNVTTPSILTETFNDYNLGTLLGQNGWSNYAVGESFLVKNLSRKNNAVYVNRLYDSVVTKTGTSLVDGRQTVMVKTENRTSWGNVPDGNVQVRISDAPWGAGTSRFVAVTFKADGNVAYYDKQTDVYQNFAVYQDNRWTQLDIEWRSSDKTARYRVNRGAWTEWISFPGSDTFIAFNNVGFAFTQPSGLGGVYFDNLK